MKKPTESGSLISTGVILTSTGVTVVSSGKYTEGVVVVVLGIACFILREILKKRK